MWTIHAIGAAAAAAAASSAVEFAAVAPSAPGVWRRAAPVVDAAFAVGLLVATSDSLEAASHPDGNKGRCKYRISIF